MHQVINVLVLKKGTTHFKQEEDERVYYHIIVFNLTFQVWINDVIP